MTSFLARVGSLESRSAAQVVWEGAKRKRRDWLCPQCSARTISRQQRMYSDDGLKVGAEPFLFPPRFIGQPDALSWPSKRVPGPERQRDLGAWSLGDEEDGGLESEHVSSRPGEGVWSAEERENALWEDFEQAEEEAEDSRSVAPMAHRSIVHETYHAGLLEIDYVSVLPRALAKNEPDTVARCLYAAERKSDMKFIQSIPRTTFAECIRVLQPSNFTAPLTTAHVEISEAMTRQLGLTPIKQVAWDLARLLQDILVIRRNAGISVGLPEYRMLLRGVRDLGQGAAADRIWQFLLADGLTPDTACYNAMMAAHAWNNMHDPETRQKVRVIPFFQIARGQASLGKGFTNYRVGSDGIKQQVMRVFGNMMKHGAVADEESFRNVIIAAAREGDMATIKSILRRIWNVDVDALSTSKTARDVLEQTMDPASPLRPNSKTLFSLAYAFGINNDIPTALRVVDHVARRYGIDIDTDVWEQLFEWTFVLAVPRTGVHAKSDGSNAGSLPLQSVLSLWETMTAAPYYIEPTMGMYNHLIRNLQHRQYPRAMQEKMWEGFWLFRRSTRDAHKAYHDLKRAVDGGVPPHPDGSVERTRREWERLDLVRQRNLWWCKRWLRLLLSVIGGFSRTDSEMDLALRDLPKMLWDWREYAPRHVWYESIGGIVEFDIRTEEEIQDKRVRREHFLDEQARILDKVALIVAEEFVRPRVRRRQDAD